MVDNFADNALNSTSLANNLVLANMDSIQQIADNTRVLQTGCGYSKNVQGDANTTVN